MSLKIYDRKESTRYKRGTGLKISKIKIGLIHTNVLVQHESIKIKLFPRG